MKYAKLIVIVSLWVHGVSAQKPAPKIVNPYADIHKKALLLPDSLSKTTEAIAGYIKSNFNTDSAKARATFTWIASNIQYDIDNMFAINFYEQKEEKIEKPLKTRKGICENYAALFNDVCLKLGIRSFVIEGYTKQNGFTDYIPHAWCTALIDGGWYVFDPTWGSGYIYNGKFYKKINNDYYKVKPSVIIKSHMPFDYLWQFLDYPVTNLEFYEGKIQPDKSKPLFVYADSIAVYEKQTRMEQLAASAKRIERNGVKNAMIFDRLRHLKLEIEQNRQHQVVDLYNSAAEDYNDGIHSLNRFIQYRNNQFTPTKTDPEIQSMVDIVANKFDTATIKLKSIKEADTTMAVTIAKLSKSIDEVAVQLKEQQDWLKTYFGKSKAKRKSMFYERKVTWFGVPLN